MGICGQKPQSINATKICTESRSEELFADLVCKNPITGESLEDSSRCKRMTSSMTCCCTHASSCEKEDKIISIVDNLFDETFDEILEASLDSIDYANDSVPKAWIRKGLISMPDITCKTNIFPRIVYPTTILF